MITDAMLWRDALVVTRHTEAGCRLHVIQLNIREHIAKGLRTQTFDSGEVTALGLWQPPGQAAVYAVACLWRDSAVYLEFHSVTSDLPIETLAVHDRKSNTPPISTDTN